MPPTDMRAFAAQVTALHAELSERAARTRTHSTVTLAAVGAPTQLRWAAPTGDTEVADIVPNTGAVLRRRLAAQLRSPRSARYPAPLIGLIRHRSAPNGTSITAVMLLDGTAAAYSEGLTASVAIGDWRQGIAPWDVPFELAEALTGAAPVTTPVEAFAAAIGVDPWEYDGLVELTAAVVEACTENPAAAESAGMDPATASLLGSLVSCPADLSDVITGRFDPWEASNHAELRWPTGCGAEEVLS